jgi:rhodanese-related sulfurtransferase
MIKPANDFIADAQQNIKCLNPTQAKELIENTKDIVILDVREPAEAAECKLACSINIPRGLLEMKVQGHCPNPETTILVHCGAGGRASLAAARLKEMGYANAHAITAKYDDLKKTLG